MPSAAFPADDGICAVHFAAASPSLVSISRHGMLVPFDLIGLWKHHLLSAASAWIDQVLSTGSSNNLKVVNLSVQERPLELSEGSSWFHFDGLAPFRPIQHPIALPIRFFGMPYKTKHGCTTRLAVSSKRPVGIIVGGSERSKIKPSCELRFLESKSPARQPPCLYWPEEGALDESIFKRFPNEWNEVGLLRVRDRNASFLSNDNSLLFLNQDHPIMAQIRSEPWCISKLLKGTSGTIWKELDEADSAELAVIAFCGLLQRSFSSIPEEWSTYSKSRIPHINHLWTLIAEKIKRPLNDIRLIATDGSHDAEITPFSLRSQSAFESPIVPRVCDPEFLLHEEAE